MNNLYKEFAEKEVISEEEFLEIIETIHYPLDESISDIMFKDPQDVDTVAADLINKMLECYDYVYVDYVNFENKNFSLIDVDSLEDLESIKKEFSNWTIDNYKELKEDLLREEEDDKEYKEFTYKRNLLTTLANKLSIEEVQELIKKYDQK